MKLKTDVVIMGSGLSGICAADALLAKGKKVIVFADCAIAAISLKK